MLRITTFYDIISCNPSLLEKGLLFLVWRTAKSASHSAVGFAPSAFCLGAAPKTDMSFRFEKR